MKHNIMYYRGSDEIECICYNKPTQSYPAHTHASHIVIGYISDGAIRITFQNKVSIYHAGEYFCIMPDVLHAIEPENHVPYSMINLCMQKDKIISDDKTDISYSSMLKQKILNAPEDLFSIENMAQSVSISPYHMIRKFKTEQGLTPHQFQIQCRIRKAQKLLEEGKSVTEVAYATGFCDQSHFDRCFRKIVRMTPSNYRQVVKRLS